MNGPLSEVTAVPLKGNRESGKELLAFYRVTEKVRALASYSGDSFKLILTA